MHLIIAEKNIAAARIAQILAGNGKVSQKREGKTTVYQFSETTVMGLRGHVVEVDFVPGYSNWRSETYPPRSLIDAKTQKKPTEPGIVNLVKKLSKKANRVTIATDFDTEGELIGKEAYEIVRSAHAAVPVDRARFSAITKKEIEDAFSHTTGIDFDLASAGETRQIIDLMWGASLTRFISLAAKRGGNNILSVGRVQSPTLAMIVDREHEIEAFVPEPYWELTVSTEKNDTPFSARHVHGKFRDKSEAETAYQATKEPLTVLETKEGVRRDLAPTPFDTTGFIVAAGRFGLSAANAMRIAEELYMNGFISYPRTDNTIYPPSLSINAILTDISGGSFDEEIAWVRKNKRESPTRGKKSSTDHPPIHPTGRATPDQLGENWKVYELIVRRFLATLSPDALWLTVKISLAAGKEPYTSTGSRLQEPGWRTVYPYSEAKDNLLPPVSKGEILPIRSKDLLEKETLPPARYSQSKLIQQMEELGLGTKSTRHEVIQKLISRKYIEGTPLRPTLVGRAVSESLKSHADAIINPDMTRALEEEMGNIRDRKITKDEVVSDSQKMLHRVFDALELNGEQIGREIMEQTNEEYTIGPCPACGNDLRIHHIRGQTQFIGCTAYPDCTFNIGLPGSMWGFAVRTKNVCEVHRLFFVNLVARGARPWEIGCPFCHHLSQQKEIYAMMPSMTDEIWNTITGSGIFSVYDLSKMEGDNLADKTGIDAILAEKITKEAVTVMDLLKKRSLCKKFIRKLIPPKKGRSHARVMNALHTMGFNEINDLAHATIRQLRDAGMTEDEATAVHTSALLLAGKERMRSYGVPAVSITRYQDAGFITPENLINTPMPYIASMTGITIETVYRHLSLIAKALGQPVPEKVTNSAFEKGKTELLAGDGIGQATLERLYRAGIYNSKTIRNADSKEIALLTGLPETRVLAMQKVFL
ncbi:MAG: DNA topoisomerase I [Methanospirillaceae archaeon]|nr:DNA topoisomerase I [Methanospirillaceae archaeon]